ncbi:alpha-hydroxy acid oxidase [Crocosphaera chwakensis]|uniref:Glycolate oxidase n=1 Tax=Crocosphaera chwakensis CCY0110 TaxID=391612 RepID=A3IHB5_9CHRO|nr:alpha-hydroxy acid oxidase [Crocosphaera chwakensis]EAZ94357.1 glycolate oxidase [Crocosphaera chwakensis CCY0110]
MIKPINLFEYESLAQQQLSSMTWGYYSSGALDEITLKNNRKSFETYQLYPKVLVDVSEINLSTTLLGQTLSIPIGVAPMAFQCLAHPQGEKATAKVLSDLKTLLILSTLSTTSLEEVAACQEHNLRWFQLYIHKDKGLTKALVERAEKAGYTAICVTVDAPMLGKREIDIRNQFTLPESLKLANLVSLEDLAIPNSSNQSGLFAYFQQQIDPSLTWKDLEWLQSITKLPIVLKGILRADDARLAVENGSKGIIVSNHGGRQLDGAITTLEALPKIVETVGNEVDIIIDGGIRRGTDVFKALALGAKAVLIGRPILWGLTVNGEAGVNHVLELLKDELLLAMALSGCPSIADINDSFLLKDHSHRTSGIQLHSNSLPLL